MTPISHIVIVKFTDEVRKIETFSSRDAAIKFAEGQLATHGQCERTECLVFALATIVN